MPPRTKLGIEPYLEPGEQQKLQDAMSKLASYDTPCTVEQRHVAQGGHQHGHHQLHCTVHDKTSTVYSYRAIAHLQCVSGTYIGTTDYFDEELPHIARIVTVLP